MRVIRGLMIASVLLLVAVSVGAQDRLNPQDPLDIAVYCAGGNIEIYHIDDGGSGQQALVASAGQVSGALASAFQNNTAATVASGDYATTLTALPGVRLLASQRFPGRSPYDFEFAGDACAPFTAPAGPVSAPGGAANPGAGATVSGATAPSSPATGNINYTIQAGDTYFRIARRFDITVGELAAANGGTAQDIIYPGQTLVIPNQVVQEPAAGDTPAEAAPSEPGVPQLVVDGSGNYLRDPSFEGLYTGRGAPNLNIPSEWGLQVFTSPREYPWQNLQPYAFPRRDPPIHGGNLSLNVNRGFATYNIVLFQRVSVPENANLEAGAWAFYDTCNGDRSGCDNSGNPVFRVGIDPNGGTNPYEGDVVWSPSIAPQQSWGTAGITARAQGSVVTYYINASQERPRAINELFIDDALLRVAG